MTCSMPGRLDGLNDSGLVAGRDAAGDASPVALAIFTFLGNWTAFLWPLIVHYRPESLYLAGGLAPSPENSRRNGRW
jgi:multiple sugar transport system permease protein